MKRQSGAYIIDVALWKEIRSRAVAAQKLGEAFEHVIKSSIPFWFKEFLDHRERDPHLAGTSPPFLSRAAVCTLLVLRALLSAVGRACATVVFASPAPSPACVLCESEWLESRECLCLCVCVLCETNTRHRRQTRRCTKFENYRGEYDKA